MATSWLIWEASGSFKVTRPEMRTVKNSKKEDRPIRIGRPVLLFLVDRSSWKETSIAVGFSIPNIRAQISFDEPVEVAIQHSLRIADLVICAVIFDHLIGMENV